jgi:hypothetical protein
MLRVRNVVILLLLIGAAYAVAPPERKKLWLDKLRELGRALAIALVLYWIYMIAAFLYHRA